MGILFIKFSRTRDIAQYVTLSSNLNLNFMIRLQFGRYNRLGFILNLFSSDPAEVPMCEISLACDNLLCDGHGRPPTPVLEVDVQSKSSKTWIKYARTEVVEVTANNFPK